MNIFITGKMVKRVVSFFNQTTQNKSPASYSRITMPDSVNFPAYHDPAFIFTYRVDFQIHKP